MSRRASTAACRVFQERVRISISGVAEGGFCSGMFTVASVFEMAVLKTPHFSMSGWGGEGHRGQSDAVGAAWDLSPRRLSRARGLHGPSLRCTCWSLRPPLGRPLPCRGRAAVRCAGAGRGKGAAHPAGGPRSAVRLRRILRPPTRTRVGVHAQGPGSVRVKGPAGPSPCPGLSRRRGLRGLASQVWEGCHALCWTLCREGTGCVVRLLQPALQTP